jgi:glutamate/tyrosine decarboxylase-like PLP-dependent enzyme
MTHKLDRIDPLTLFRVDESMPEIVSAPWRERLKVLETFFPSPWKEPHEDSRFEEAFRAAVEAVNQLKHEPQSEEGLIPSLGGPARPEYTSCRDAAMCKEMGSLGDVILELVRFFDGMPHWNHPLALLNVTPPANTASTIGAMLSGIFNPNIIQGEASWNVGKSELEAVAMVARLVGWDPYTAGGIFTFGGTGCYLYGTKLGLTAVLGKESRARGIREDGQVLVSASGHYVKDNCTDWTGLGTNSIRQVQTDPKNAMDVEELEHVMADCRQRGQPVVLIVCTMGTTDAFGIDPIASVRRLIDSYENAKGYPKPLLYADAVIGWSWLAFRTYDFGGNPLGFSADVLQAIERNYRLMKPVSEADAIGCDFHKTGWTPYNCSLFLVKDDERFKALMGRPPPAYSQPRTDYNPHLYSLEASRTGAYSLAAWAALRLFGYTRGSRCCSAGSWK